MASFTGVGDNVELQLADKDEEFTVALSGTYNMTILLQCEVGAPGSGSWKTLKTYSTANATVSDKFYTSRFNQKVRLIVDVDTSGTCTATITDSAREQQGYLTVRDRVGNKISEVDQGSIKFYRGIRDPAPILITAAITLTVEEHAGRLLAFDIAAGVTATLPAATGSGAKFRFFVKTTVTSVGDKIQVANATDVMAGNIIVGQDAADTAVLFEAAATSDTITLNGTTTGGLKGDYIELEDVAAGLWRVSGVLAATGVEATPFSAAV